MMAACANAEICGGVTYPPEVTNLTPSLPLGRRRQGSGPGEFDGSGNLTVATRARDLVLGCDCVSSVYTA